MITFSSSLTTKMTTFSLLTTKNCSFSLPTRKYFSPFPPFFFALIFSFHTQKFVFSQMATFVMFAIPPISFCPLQQNIHNVLRKMPFVYHREPPLTDSTAHWISRLTTSNESCPSKRHTPVVQESTCSPRRAS